MIRSVLRRTLWGLGSGRLPACRVRPTVCRPHVQLLEDRTVPSGEPILVVTAQANPFSTTGPGRSRVTPAPSQGPVVTPVALLASGGGLLDLTVA